MVEDEVANKPEEKSVLEEAREIRDEIRKEKEELKKEKEELAQIKAKDMLGGRSEATIPEPEKKEQSDHEYRKEIEEKMRNGWTGDKEDGS